MYIFFRGNKEVQSIVAAITGRQEWQHTCSWFTWVFRSKYTYQNFQDWPPYANMKALKLRALSAFHGKVSYLCYTRWSFSSILYTLVDAPGTNILFKDMLLGNWSASQNFINCHIEYEYLIYLAYFCQWKYVQFIITRNANVIWTTDVARPRLREWAFIFPRNVACYCYH